MTRKIKPLNPLKDKDQPLMSSRSLDVVAIGNAIVDVLAHTDDAFIQSQSASGMIKGAMALIEQSRAVELYALMNDTVERSGGSAGNTIAGVASFGGKGAYIGKVADDTLGQVFRKEMRDMGVVYNTTPLIVGAPTARCLVFVTPDAQRTMNTYLGACLELGVDDLDSSLIQNAQVTYLEGYMFDPEQAKAMFRSAADIAHKSGNRVALSLSDPFCVDRHREDFQNFVENHTDILFANEAEIISLYQTETFEQAAKIVAGKVGIAALTRSEKGSVIVANGEFIEIAAAPVAQLMDTTGAGDQYAAGFLYGLTQGMDLQMCGQLGSLAAAEVISHMGPRPEMAYADFVTKVAKAA